MNSTLDLEALAHHIAAQLGATVSCEHHPARDHRDDEPGHGEYTEYEAYAPHTWLWDENGSKYLRTITEPEFSDKAYSWYAMNEEGWPGLILMMMNGLRPDPKHATGKK